MYVSNIEMAEVVFKLKILWIWKTKNRRIGEKCLFLQLFAILGKSDKIDDRHKCLVFGSLFLTKNILLLLCQWMAIIHKAY